MRALVRLDMAHARSLNLAHRPCACEAGCSTCSCSTKQPHGAGRAAAAGHRPGDLSAAARAVGERDHRRDARRPAIGPTAPGSGAAHRDDHPWRGRLRADVVPGGARRCRGAARAAVAAGLRRTRRPGRASPSATPLGTTILWPSSRVAVAQRRVPAYRGAALRRRPWYCRGGERGPRSAPGPRARAPSARRRRRSAPASATSCGG